MYLEVLQTCLQILLLPLAGWVTSGKVLTLLNHGFTVGKARTLRTVASLYCRIQTQERHCSDALMEPVSTVEVSPVITPSCRGGHGD